MFNNLETICPSPYKFGMWVYMEDPHIKFELGPWPSNNRPMKAT